MAKPIQYCKVKKINPKKKKEDPLESEVAPTPLFLLGKLHGQRSLVGCSPWDWKEFHTIKHILPINRNENFKTVPLTLSPKMCEILGIKLISYLQDLVSITTKHS